MSEMELIDIVDESDNVVGKGTRTDKKNKGFISRNVIVVLRDDEGKYVISVRGPNVDSFPNQYQFAACGDVHSGEDYSTAAYRELREELGVTCRLHFLTKKYKELQEDGVTYRHFTGFFYGVYNGSFSPSEEIAEVIKITAGKLADMVRRRDKLLPDYFLEEYGIVKPLIE